MDVKPNEIREYLTVNGKNPFREWLCGHKDIETRARIRVRISRIRLGNYGDSKSVGDGVFELRIPFGSGYRIYFGKDGNLVAILLCGGDKSTQKKDIQKAKEFWDDYKRRSI